MNYAIVSLGVLFSIIAYGDAINCYYCDGGQGCADPYYPQYSKIQKIECTQHCFKDEVTDEYRDPITDVTTERAFIRRGCSSSKCQKGCKDNNEGGRTCRHCCKRDLCNAATDMKSMGLLLAVVMVVVARVFRA